MLHLGVECVDDKLVVRSNGIPHYRFIPMTPNALVEQDFNWEITLTPEGAPEPTDIPLLGLVGFTVNGQPFFSPNEGPQPADEAWGDPIYNQIMDECLGHTAFSYHYHALVERCLTQAGVVDEPWSNPAQREFPPVRSGKVHNVRVLGGASQPMQIREHPGRCLPPTA